MSYFYDDQINDIKIQDLIDDEHDKDVQATWRVYIDGKMNIPTISNLRFLMTVEVGNQIGNVGLAL